MIAAVRIEEATFRSQGVDCAARVYRSDVSPGQSTPCVVMANGFSLTRDDGLPAFAERFAGVGITALRLSIGLSQGAADTEHNRKVSDQTPGASR
jgi:hypothetical protein